MATEAVRWLKGEPDVAPELRKQFDITDVIDKDNAFDLLRAMATLIAHIGYAGLIVLCDETEVIRSISRPESRDAAYENIRLLMDKATQGEFTHCGFMFTGTRDLLDDAHRGIASYPVLHERWRPKRAMRRTKNGQQPVILLEGFDRRKLHEVARKVRNVHGIAHDWDPSAHLTDELLTRLLESTAARVGDKLTTAPRGFLKVLVDMLDELEQNRHRSAAEAIALGINTDRIEDIEREEARLLDHA
jgi:adenosylhomocysteinase